MHGKLWEVVNWPCSLWSLQQNLSSVCMATWINPWPKPKDHATAAAPPTRKHTDASEVLRAAPAGVCWVGKVASLTGANASQLCWIFMQMHPTPLLPPQDTQTYKKNPVLTHVGGCSTQELNTKLENTITAIIPGGEPLLGAAPHLRLSNVSVRTQPSKARLQGNPPWESTHLSSLSLKNNCFPSWEAFKK